MQRSWITVDSRTTHTHTHRQRLWHIRPCPFAWFAFTCTLRQALRGFGRWPSNKMRQTLPLTSADFTIFRLVTGAPPPTPAMGQVTAAAACPLSIRCGRLMICYAVFMRLLCSMERVDSCSDWMEPKLREFRLEFWVWLNASFIHLSVN